MKNTGKRITAMALALGMSLCLAGMTAGGAETSAKSAKIKLNRKKAILRVGKKLKLKVKGTKKKVKWRSSKKKVATVSKKGVVKAKKPGKTVITAKAGKKKCRCEITVKKKTTKKKTLVSARENAQLAKALEIKSEQALDGSILFSIKNNNKTMVKYASVTAAWKDDQGEELSEDFYIYFLPAGQTCYLAVERTEERDANDRPFYSKPIMSTMKYSDIAVDNNYSSSKDVTSTAQITNNPLKAGDTKATVSVKNNSSSRYDSMYLTVALYDAAGRLLSVDTQDFTTDEDAFMESGGFANFLFDFPHDYAKNEVLTAASYKRLYVMIRSNTSAASDEEDGDEDDGEDDEEE